MRLRGGVLTRFRRQTHLLPPQPVKMDATRLAEARRLAAGLAPSVTDDAPRTDTQLRTVLAGGPLPAPEDVPPTPAPTTEDGISSAFANALSLGAPAAASSPAVRSPTVASERHVGPAAGAVYDMLSSLPRPNVADCEAPTSPSAEAKPVPGLMALGEPLPFVNRYAEALDVLIPNLHNHQALHVGYDIKFMAPLAAQPPGTGKTALGRNIPAILSRPRDDAATEAAIAKQLAGAWSWRGLVPAVLTVALHDTRDENLVMRTLMALSDPVHHETLVKLKSAKPLVIEMKGLVLPRLGLGFDGALAYAIYCNARGLDGSEPATEDAFLAQRMSQQSAEGAVKQLMRERDGAPVLLVLDDITDLADPDFQEYFKGAKGGTLLHCAMSKLSATLQELHAIPRCFVYCTGPSLWQSSRALIGSGSPLNVQPTLLQPLTPSDVLQAMRAAPEPGGRSLLDSLGVAPGLAEQFAERAVDVTGGVCRALQYLLREQQWSAANGAPVITSADELRPAFERLRPHLASLPGNMLRIDWDGPQAVASGDLPQSVLQPGVPQRLLQLLARTLLLDATFPPEYTVKVGGDALRLSDVAATFGLSYSPAEAPRDASDAPAGDSPAKGRSHLRLVAGKWLCESLQDAASGDLSALASAQLLVTMRDFGGTMRGRPFEMLCADSLCHRSLLAPDRPLAQLLPHLSRTTRGNDRVPRLQVVALPKAVADGRLPRLSAEEKATLLQSPNRWTGKGTIRTEDLPWLLAEWLPVGCLGVPADAQSGSQDMFLRLRGGVVGLALNAAGATAGTGWAALREAMSKAPAMPSATPYTLVVWSLHLAPQLREAIFFTPAPTFGPGTWVLRNRELLLKAATAAGSSTSDGASAVSEDAPARYGAQKPAVNQATASAAGGAAVPDAAQNGEVEVFTVSPGMELVVVNPYGLYDLLDGPILEQLDGMADGAGSMSISHLAHGIAPAPTPATQ